MRSALFKFALFFLVALGARAQINPNTQIAWPQPSCNTPGAPYNPADNVCTTSTSTGGLPTANPQYTGTMQGPNAVLNTTLTSVGNEQNVMAPPYNAVCNGTADDTVALAAAITAAGQYGTIRIPANKVCKTSGITISCNNKLRAINASLIPQGPNQTVVTVAGGSCPLQGTRNGLIEGLEINGASQTGTTGLIVNNVANFTTKDMVIHDCGTVGQLLQGAQFDQFDRLDVYNNYVGMKIYSVVGQGGGNSNSFYSFKAVANTVGVLQANPAGYPMGSNYFYNASMLSNSVAATAVFGGDIEFYGGAPENNSNPASGPSSVTIDGYVIPKTTYYLNKSSALFDEVYFADAQANPEITAQNNSVVNLRDALGFGQSFGTLVQTDANSIVKETSQGTIGSIHSLVQWPAVMLPGMSQFAIDGFPLYIPQASDNDYAGNAQAPPFVGFNGATSSTVNDPLYGTINQVTFAPSVSNQDVNRAQLGTNPPTVTAPSVPYDALASVLVKSNINCVFSLIFYGQTIANAASLKAGQWTRLVIFIGNLPASSSLNLMATEGDSLGATVSFANLEVNVGPAASFSTVGRMSNVLRTGGVFNNAPTPTGTTGNDYNMVTQGGIDNTGGTEVGPAVATIINGFTGTANAPVIYFPPGTYKINNGVQLNCTTTACNGLIVRGAGKAQTIFQSTCANGYAWWWNGSAVSGSYWYGTMMRDLKVQDTSGSGACNSLVRRTQMANYVDLNLELDGAQGHSYATGTVSVSNGSTVLTGSGTTFTAAMVPGVLRIANKPQMVCGFTDATHLTLCGNWQQTTASGAGFSLSYNGQGYLMDGGTNFIQYGAAYNLTFVGDLFCVASVPSTSGSIGVSRNKFYGGFCNPQRIANSIGFVLGQYTDSIQSDMAINNAATCWFADGAHDNKISGECEDDGTPTVSTTCNGGVASQTCLVGAEFTGPSNGTSYGNVVDGILTANLGVGVQRDSTNVINLTITNLRAASFSNLNNYSLEGTTGCPASGSTKTVTIFAYDCVHSQVAATVNLAQAPPPQMKLFLALDWLLVLIVLLIVVMIAAFFRMSRRRRTP